jgi:phosphoribosylformylglycinamidine synthase
VDGIKEACEAFETPIVSGNVSFYNETEGRGILPTPTIGMVGLIEDVRKIITPGFKTPDDIIALLGETKDDLAASEYEQTILGLTTGELIENGEVPALDLNLEKRVQETCLNLADALLINSAHDCSDGGLAVAIAESCFSGLNHDAVGAEIDLKDENLDAATHLFGETPSRIVISFSAEKLNEVERIATANDCPFQVIGKVSGADLKIKFNGAETVSASVAELEDAWKTSLEKQLEN